MLSLISLLVSMRILQSKKIKNSRSRTNYDTYLYSTLNNNYTYYSISIYIVVPIIISLLVFLLFKYKKISSKSGHICMILALLIPIIYTIIILTFFSDYFIDYRAL